MAILDGLGTFVFACGIFWWRYQTDWLEDVGLELELDLFSERELVVLVVAHAFIACDI
jgi:hypothetical protein